MLVSHGATDNDFHGKVNGVNRFGHVLQTNIRTVCQYYISKVKVFLGGKIEALALEKMFRGNFSRNLAGGICPHASHLDSANIAQKSRQTSFQLGTKAVNAVQPSILNIMNAKKGRSKISVYPR